MLALVRSFGGEALLAGRPFIPFSRYRKATSFAPSRAGPRRSLPSAAGRRHRLIFCVGTTSRPKLVVHVHLLRPTGCLIEALGLTEDDRTLEYRSFGWNSAQVMSLMPFLETGLTLHIARRFSLPLLRLDQETHHLRRGRSTVVNMLLNKPLGYTARVADRG